MKFMSLLYAIFIILFHCCLFRILVNLTVPVECLLPLDVMLKTDTGRNTIYELNWLLTSCKEAFLDPRSTRNIITHIQIILDKVH